MQIFMIYLVSLTSPNLPDQFLCFFCPWLCFLAQSCTRCFSGYAWHCSKAIATTYGVPTWGPFRLLPHYHPNEKTECLCGWMENRGGSSMAGRTINPLCGLSEFWSLTCYTLLVLLASSTATVTLSNCLPSWVNVLLQSSGSPFLCHATASATAAMAVAAVGSIKWGDGVHG